MPTIEHVNGSDTKLPFVLKQNKKLEPLNLNLGEGDSITVLIPGQTTTIVKKLTNVLTDVIIDSNDRGEFSTELNETDLVKVEKSQNIVVKIKRGGEDIIKEFQNVLDVIAPSLTE